ncbi:MAG: hypothetical protein MUC86_12020 [Burkholderiaceae bacterium]|jgi:hypothetical protein|nr:hypothetical protein [Burkholderiaceae bacterium]
MTAWNCFLSGAGGFQNLPGVRYATRARADEALRAVLYEIFTRTMKLRSRP